MAISKTVTGNTQMSLKHHVSQKIRKYLIRNRKGREEKEGRKRNGGKGREQRREGEMKGGREEKQHNGRSMLEG